MGEFGIGQSVPREEDPYLVRGAGRYVDDVTVTGQLRGFVLRSPHAHARIRSINTEAARSMPGVHLVLTGRDAAWESSDRWSRASGATARLRFPHHNPPSHATSSISPATP